MYLFFILSSNISNEVYRIVQVEVGKWSGVGGLNRGGLRRGNGGEGVGDICEGE